MDFIQNSVYFGIILSLVSYGIGSLMHKKLKLEIFNPLLISVIITIIILMASNISYESYLGSAKFLSFFITPTTVCLAVNLYEKFEVLKENKKAVLIGILSGVLTNILCVFAMSLAIGFSHEEYITFLPKSLTTAIGIDLSSELGGNPNLTASIIMITGISGNILARPLCRIFKITEPVARGIAIGTASHAIGTTKALEIGEVEGAMSGLSIGVSGIMTVLFASIFSNLI